MASIHSSTILPLVLYFNMKHKHWGEFCILALLKKSLDFFHGVVNGDGTLGNQEGNPLNCTSSGNHSTERHNPMQVSVNSFPLDTTRTSFPPVTKPVVDLKSLNECGKHKILIYLSSNLYENL